MLGCCDSEEAAELELYTYLLCLTEPVRKMDSLCIYIALYSFLNSCLLLAVK